MSSVTADILTVGFFKGKRIEAVSTLSEKKRVVDSDFADEWDRVRFMLNPHAKKA